MTQTQEVPGPGWQRRVTLFLVSQSISLFGSSVVGFAVMWHITLETSSGLWMTLATLASTLPQIFLTLFGGVWADRYSRKWLIMAADGGIALATLGLAVAFFLGFGRLELLLVILVIRSVGGGIQSPAVTAIFPQLVPQDKLTKMMGINQTVNSVLFLVSPAVGGMLYGALGVGPTLFVDVVTALAAILVMAQIQVGKVAGSGEPQTFWQDLKTGMGYTFGKPQLRLLIFCYLASFFLLTPVMTLSPLLVERSFGREVWRLTTYEIIWTVGMLLGGLFVSVRGAFKNKPRAIAICLVAFGLTTCLMGLAPGFLSFLVINAMAGCFVPPLHAVEGVYLQELTDPDKLGRVSSVVQLISAGAVPLGVLLFGPLADLIRVEAILIATGALLAVVGFAYGRAARRLPS